MALEKKEGMLSRLDTKQKVMMAVLIVIVLVVLWQVIGLFGGGGEPQPIPPPVPVAQKGGAKPMSATSPSAIPAAQPPQIQPIKEAPIVVDNKILEIEKQTQQRYMDSLNQLQLLKIQRDIAETNQAIATAKLATVTAEKSVSDLLTRPSLQQAALSNIPVGAYSNMLVNPTASGTSIIPPQPQQAGPAPGVPPSETTTTEKPPAITSAPPPPAEVQYSVISVSMQMGKWTAVLGVQGKLYSVTIGDILPSDKSVVASINRNGVVLVKDGKKRTISILSSI